MGKYSHSQFELEGRFLGFAAEEGYKLKLLRLSTLSGEYRVKIPKELRPLLYRTLVPGEWIEVSGYQKLDSFKGTVKLKAIRVVPSTPHRSLPQPASQPASVTPVMPFGRSALQPIGSEPTACAATTPTATLSKGRAKTDTILVCQKSDCCKRGAGAVIKALQSELEERGLTDVKIRGTGCMKQCKAGPNLVMPDKSRYCRIRPEEVAAVVDKHFPVPSEVAS